MQINFTIICAAVHSCRSTCTVVIATEKCSFTISVMITISLTISTGWILAAFWPINSVWVQTALITFKVTFSTHAVRVIIALCCAASNPSLSNFTVISSTYKWSIAFRMWVTSTLSLSAHYATTKITISEIRYFPTVAFASIANHSSETIIVIGAPRQGNDEP